MKLEKRHFYLFMDLVFRSTTAMVLFVCFLIIFMLGWDYLGMPPSETREILWIIYAFITSVYLVYKIK